MTDITVDCHTTTGPQTHFWRSMGFTPASLLLEPAMRQTVAYNGAIPHQGIRYARIHFLLDLVEADGLGTTAPVYRWERLDRAIDHLIDHGLLPFFELMGNPSEWFTDLEQPRQLHAFRNLVEALARHCQERYGADCVRDWYFETWNEPDLPWWKHSSQAFLHYYDACSDALLAVDPAIRFGGPGTCETLHPLFTDLMDHCASGTNYFTGETGVRLDFISFHEKAGKWSNEAVNPSVDLVMDSTHRIVDWLRQHHPDFLTKPLINNECDPLIGWKQFHSWRALPYYAATVCRLIDRHQRELIDAGLPFAFLSSDNGFIGRWGQRSQLAVFGKDEDIPQGRFELIKKPVLNVMTALSLLGDERLSATLDGDARIGCLATRRQDQIVVLVYGQDDRVRMMDRRPVDLHIDGCAAGTWRLAHWRISEDQGHPFATWEAGGYSDLPDKPPETALWPDRPDPTLYPRMRAMQELRCAAPPRDLAVADDGRVVLALQAEIPSVHCLVLSRDPGRPPEQVAGLRHSRWPGRGSVEQILLQWDGLADRHLLGYEVAHRSSEADDWQSLTDHPLLDCAWLHCRSGETAGEAYRVRAVDYWQRPGPWSEPLHLPAPLA